MRSLTLLAVVALVATSSLVMADEPQSAATPAPAAASDKAAAPAAPTATENSAKAPARPATAAKADEEWKPPLGYKKEKRDGLVVYCRRDVENGSRFTRKTCYTREDLEFVIARNKADSDDLIRNTRVCGSSAVCSNQ